MPDIIRIESLEGPELMKFFRLSDAQLRPASFVAESPNVILRALENGFEPEAVLCEERLAGPLTTSPADSTLKGGNTFGEGPNGGSLNGSLRGAGADAAAVLQRLGDCVPVYVAPREMMSQITGYNLIRGMMCAFKRPAPKSPADVVTSFADTSFCPSRTAGKAPSKHVILSKAKNLPPARRIAVLDGVVDAANVGAIFRSAAALGMNAVLLHESCDPLNRRSIRSSMGAVFQVPWAVLDTGTGSIRNCTLRSASPPAAGTSRDGAAMKALRDLGFKTVAMALRDDSICLENSRLAEEPHLAIVLGNEGYGLPAAEIAAADYVVRIPMAHGVDSLSVTSAAAIAFWQLR